MYLWNCSVLEEDEEEERVLITHWKIVLPILSDLELLILQTQMNGLESIQLLPQSFLFLLVNPREEAGNDNPQVREICLSGMKTKFTCLLKYLCGRAKSRISEKWRLKAFLPFPVKHSLFLQWWEGTLKTFQSSKEYVIYHIYVGIFIFACRMEQSLIRR